MKKQPATLPVDLASLRGLSSHAESHWLTFATAMKCYCNKNRRSTTRLKRAAEKHGPSWLRSALHAQAYPTTTTRRARPKELDPKTGSLSFLTAGAEEALVQGRAPTQEGQPQLPRTAKASTLLPQKAEKQEKIREVNT